MDPNGRQLWSEAMGQVRGHWLDGPRRYNEHGELLVGGEPVVAKPAFRFGAQQGKKLRAVGDLKRSSTDDAAYRATPINLPSRGHVARMLSLLYL